MITFKLKETRVDIILNGKYCHSVFYDKKDTPADFLQKIKFEINNSYGLAMNAQAIFAGENKRDGWQEWKERKEEEVRILQKVYREYEKFIKTNTETDMIKALGKFITK